MHTRVLTVALLTVVLGLLGGPSAEGSCAGPQLSVLDASFTPVPPGSSDLDAEPTYSVRAGKQVTVHASNFGPCRDTYAVNGGGFGRQSPQPPVAAPETVEDVALHLEQGSRRWSLGLADATAPSLAIDYLVNLPQDLKPGRATLSSRGRPC